LAKLVVITASRTMPAAAGYLLTQPQINFKARGEAEASGGLLDGPTAFPQ
jgi:hypothetical protein